MQGHGLGGPRLIGDALCSLCRPAPERRWSALPRLRSDTASRCRLFSQSSLMVERVGLERLEVIFESASRRFYVAEIVPDTPQTAVAQCPPLPRANLAALKAIMLFRFDIRDCLE